MVSLMPVFKLGDNVFVVILSELTVLHRVNVTDFVGIIAVILVEIVSKTRFTAALTFVRVLMAPPLSVLAVQHMVNKYVQAVTREVS